MDFKAIFTQVSKGHFWPQIKNYLSAESVSYVKLFQIQYRLWHTN